jgi:hypothetical protein
MRRTDYREVSVIQRRHFAASQSFGDGDNGRIGRSERQISVLLYEPSHALVVA